VLRSGQSVAGVGRAERMSGEPAVAITGRADLCAWVTERPATTVQGDPRIGRPGHKDRDKGESQFEQDSVRITVQEAAVLQSFAPDYPWQGTKTKQFEQVGNAIPPLLAEHVLAMATGIQRLERAA
jgi:DNA (cytosine-5)-methyltransferase 1